MKYFTGLHNLKLDKYTDLAWFLMSIGNSR